MGQWIELRKEKRPKTEKVEINPDLTFKRNLNGLQDGGVYNLNGGLHNTMGVPQVPQRNRGDTLS